MTERSADAASRSPAEAAYPAVDLAPGVRMLEVQERFPSSNALLLEGDETVLVDAGLAPDRLRALAPALDRVLVTHFHLDHAKGLPCLEGIPVTANGAEEPAFRGEAADVADFLELGHPWRDRFVDEFADGFPTVDVDRWFSPGETLNLAGIEVETVPAPGHSPGHAMLWFPGKEVLFSVDVDFRGWGPWYGWPHCDPTAFEEAAAEARDLFREADVVATSHSAPVEGGDEAAAKVDGFLEVFRERDEAVATYLEETGPGGATLPELVEGVRLFYGEHLGARPWHEYWCREMTGMHLERLADAGRVLRDGAVWRPR